MPRTWLPPRYMALANANRHLKEVVPVLVVFDVERLEFDPPCHEHECEWVTNFVYERVNVNRHSRGSPSTGSLRCWTTRIRSTLSRTQTCEWVTNWKYERVTVLELVVFHVKRLISNAPCHEHASIIHKHVWMSHEHTLVCHEYTYQCVPVLIVFHVERRISKPTCHEHISMSHKHVRMSHEHMWVSHEHHGWVQVLINLHIEGLISKPPYHRHT